MFVASFSVLLTLIIILIKAGQTPDVSIYGSGLKKTGYSSSRKGYR